jgi:putative hydrolase of the HAD superfamily
MAEIKAAFWDNGGVILTNGWDRDARKRAIEKFHLEWEEFEDRHELMLHAFECGTASLDEYLKRTVFYRERPFSSDEFKKFMFEQSQAMPESLAFVRKLTKDKSILHAALNNESLEINDYRVHTFQLRDCFEAFFSSCYLGARKPDPEIYQLALKITQCAPQECVMVDDRALNLECAKELGMHTIQFKNVAQLEAELGKLGVTVKQEQVANS